MPRPLLLLQVHPMIQVHTYTRTHAHTHAHTRTRARAQRTVDRLCIQDALPCLVFILWRILPHHDKLIVMVVEHGSMIVTSYHDIAVHKLLCSYVW